MTPENISARETDNLTGSVRAVRYDGVALRRHLGRLVESKRLPMESLRFDERGNRLEWVFFDEAGAVEKRYAFTYDDANRRIKSVVQGSGGDVIETCTYAYDDQGRLCEDTITDARRPGVAYSHVCETTNGQRVIVRYRSDGKPARSEILTFNDRGRLIEMSVFGQDGKLAHQWIYGYDRHSRRTSEISLWADGSFRSKELCSYNDRGDEYKIAVYGSDGSLSMKWAYTYSYDGAGNWIRRRAHLKSRSLGEVRYRPVGVVYRTIEYAEESEAGGSARDRSS